LFQFTQFSNELGERGNALLNRRLRKLIRLEGKRSKGHDSDSTQIQIKIRSRQKPSGRRLHQLRAWRRVAPLDHVPASPAAVTKQNQPQQPMVRACANVIAGIASASPMTKTPRNTTPAHSTQRSWRR
jgi:hypothetical protein